MLFESKLTLVLDWVALLQERCGMESLWMGLCVLLGLGIVWSSVGLFLNPVGQLLVQQGTEEKQPGRAYQMHADVIVNAPYFGVYAASLGEDLSLSHLNVQIVGILFSNNPDLSQVVLRNESGFDHLYKNGDSIQAGVMIQSIHPEGMVILNHGKLERLKLDQKKLRFDPASSPLIIRETDS